MKTNASVSSISVLTDNLTCTYTAPKTEHATTTWQIDGFNQQQLLQQWQQHQQQQQQKKEYSWILILLEVQCIFVNVQSWGHHLKNRTEKPTTTKT